MDFTESFLTALDSLRVNKLRAGLTMLGVIIGVGAVIALMSVGNGFNVYVTQQIQSIGTNLIVILTDPEKSNGYPAMSMSDTRALADPSRTPSVRQVAASVQSNRELLYQKNKTTVSVLGVTLNYFEIYNLTAVALGGLFTQQDMDTHARVVVLGYTTASDLFGDVFPIGESIKIGGTNYRVVGVLAEKGGAQFSPDTQVYVPLSTAQAYISRSRTRRGEMAVSNISVTATSEQATDSAIREVTNVLRQTHGIVYAGDDDFRIVSQRELLSTFGNITGALTLFLGAIAGISLLVGGIGIMNIMLVSVTERTREIGVRKAIGALRRDVLAQFLIEALVLGLVGGLVGTLLGWGLALVIGPALQITAIVDAGTVLMANSVAVGVGLVFGIYPAWRASQLRPIEALRYE